MDYFLIGKCRNCHKEVKQKNWYLSYEKNIEDHPNIKDRANNVLTNYPFFHECDSDKTIGMCDIIRIEE